jgi:oxygen-independent coproporphyrinogen-3 oxidase
MDAIGLYVHIPFCRNKCAYCDFNSYAGLEDLFDDYTAALAREMEQARPARVRTMYIGGGTPTVLPLLHLAQIVDAARRAFAVDRDAEISIEANPGTVDAGTLAGLRALGINRLSLGVQSLDDAELRLLGRIHTAAEAVEACQAARQAGFTNLNLDLIYGLPGQTSAAWQATLERALVLRPDHLSLYALGVEEGTPLAAAIAQGALPAPDPDLAAEMYEWAEDRLSAAGYLHYEISNWARGPAFRCRHNLTYWRNGPTLGIGAGAHSWLGGRRWANVAHPAEYTSWLLGGGCCVAAEEEIGPALEVGETMMMGLRLLDEGVPFARFRERFGEDLRQRFGGELAELAALGLIVTDDRRIRLSRHGRLLGNQVFLRFLPGSSDSGC